MKRVAAKYVNKTLQFLQMANCQVILCILSKRCSIIIRNILRYIQLNWHSSMKSKLSTLLETTPFDSLFRIIEEKKNGRNQYKMILCFFYVNFSIHYNTHITIKQGRNFRKKFNWHKYTKPNQALRALVLYNVYINRCDWTKDFQISGCWRAYVCVRS